MAFIAAADVVFCLDASASMGAFIAAVKEHLGSFVDGLQSGANHKYDVRLDFLAHRASDLGDDELVFDARSLHNRDFSSIWRGLYGSQGQPGSRFFTADIAEFKRGLEEISATGDESALVALDWALDYPWRLKGTSHRVVVMLTDEPAEQGAAVPWQRCRLDDLCRKIQALGVMLFLVGPQSKIFDALAQVDRSEYEVIDPHADGIAVLDFEKVLGFIGKTVSRSRQQGAVAESSITRGLFDQRNWVSKKVLIRGQ